MQGLPRLACAYIHYLLLELLLMQHITHDVVPQAVACSGGGAEDIGQVFNVLWDLNIGL